MRMSCWERMMRRMRGRGFEVRGFGGKGWYVRMGMGDGDRDRSGRRTRSEKRVPCMILKADKAFSRRATQFVIYSVPAGMSNRCTIHFAIVLARHLYYLSPCKIIHLLCQDSPFNLNLSDFSSFSSFIPLSPNALLSLFFFFSFLFLHPSPQCHAPPHPQSLPPLTKTPTSKPSTSASALGSISRPRY